jgi:hypothetical protein
MTKTHSVQSGLLSACLAVAAGIAFLAPSQDALAGDAGPVKCGELKNAKLNAFCLKNEGKRAKVKGVMKKAQEAYKKDSGNDIKCLTCHTTGDGGELKKGESDKYWSKKGDKGGFEEFLNAAVDAAK